MAQYHFSSVINGLAVDAVYSSDNVENIFLPLLRKWTELQKVEVRRIVILLAAPPGAGKTTLAQFLHQLSISEEGLTPVTVLGMDGFHRRQEYLLSHTVNRNGEKVAMVRIKGAPVTFDFESLYVRVKRVAAGENCPWPTYNRLLHNPQDNAFIVSGNIVLLEGNYLLLDEDGWREMKDLADDTVRIVADREMLRDRLIARKAASGTSYEEAVDFVDTSDLENADICLTHSLPANLTLRLLPDGTFCALAPENGAVKSIQHLNRVPFQEVT